MSDTAYYYPAPYWTSRDGGWIKSLLLFFDDIATLLPDYMYGRHILADPGLTAPLEERSLLRVLEPKDWIDEEATNQLANIIVEMLTNGAFDDLPKADYFAELSQSRMGYSADVGLATFVVDELQNKGLAKPSEDGVSIPLHPTVRTTILVILGQLSRTVGHKRGMTIHPTTKPSPSGFGLDQNPIHGVNAIEAKCNTIRSRTGDLRPLINSSRRRFTIPRRASRYLPFLHA